MGKYTESPQRSHDILITQGSHSSVQSLQFWGILVLAFKEWMVTDWNVFFVEHMSSMMDHLDQSDPSTLPPFDRYVNDSQMSEMNLCQHLNPESQNVWAQVVYIYIFFHLALWRRRCRSGVVSWLWWQFWRTELSPVLRIAADTVLPPKSKRAPSCDY